MDRIRVGFKTWNQDRAGRDPERGVDLAIRYLAPELGPEVLEPLAEKPAPLR